MAANPLWLAAAAALAVMGVHAFSRYVGYTDLQHPAWIVWTTVEALLWAGVLLAYLNARLGLPRWAERALAALGATSFSIYVMHTW